MKILDIYGFNYLGNFIKFQINIVYYFKYKIYKKPKDLLGQSLGIHVLSSTN